MICNLFPPPTFFLYSPDVPALLYYAHIPINIVALLISLYAFWNNRESLLNKLLLVVSASFSLWTISNLILWTNINSDLMIFVWSWLGMILGVISISSIYLMYVFLEKKDVSDNIKAVFFVLLAPIILLAHTAYNLSGFNITTCDAFQYEWSPYKFYSSFLGILAMVWIFILIVRRYRAEKTNFRKQIILMGVGIELFLFSFFSMEFLASYLTKIGMLPDSGLEIYGLFGMVIFMFFIILLTVRFQTFHVRLFGAQALVIGLITLIGSKLFTAEAGASRVITIVTLGFVSLFGYFLIRSVKKEIETREHIEALADQLEQANERLHILDQQKSQFVSIASHQLRAPLTAIKGYLSMIMEGDYGKVEGELREIIQRVMDSSNNLVTIVGDFLDVSRIEQGRMTYDWKDFDLKQLVETVGNEMRPVAQKRGLEFSVSEEEGQTFMVHADMNKIKQVFTNLVDNSIKYTPKGKVWIVLSRPTPETLRFEVNDNGIGIDEQTLPKLFEKFTRAEGANDVNVIGTGLGLFVAKEMIRAHEGGRIWAESDGKGLGSTFVVELKAL